MSADSSGRIIIKPIEKDARTKELITGLLVIWEASVRASHHFLTESDIRDLYPQAEEAIRQIDTLLVTDYDGSPIGFMAYSPVK